MKKSYIYGMKIDDNLPIFSISAVAKLTNTPARMIREYEKQGLIKPRKIGGRRLFTGCEIGFINEIRYYLDKRQMTIPGLREFYFRASCWEIKRCKMPKCPAYANVQKQCWQVIKHHKKCDPSICPTCPIFIIKVSDKKQKESDITGPLAYHEK